LLEEDTTAIALLVPDERSPLIRLQQFADRHHQHPEALLALGALLALTGNSREALPHLDAADQISWKMTNDSRRAMARYMYIDSCVALGSRPNRTFSEMIEVPHIQAFGDGLYTHSWFQNDYYFICRSWMMLDGVVAPFSSTSQLSAATGSPEPREISIGVSDVATAIEWWADRRQIESVHREQLQTRTDIGALGILVKRNTASIDEFLIGTINNLMPRQRRQRVIDELRKRIKNWGTVPQRARDQLVAARYIGDDPELYASESTSVSLFAIGLAVEVTAKRYLPLGPGS
jgi:hypothetical protein